VLKYRVGSTVNVRMDLLTDDNQPLTLLGVQSVTAKLLDPEQGTELYSIPCTIVDANNGVIEFSLASVSTGIYERKFEIIYSDNSILMLPNTRQEYVMVW